MLRYLCDTKRHLICVPYSLENLHKMANDLGIGRHWFHNSATKLYHYDIPKSRIDEITKHCEIVPSNRIVEIIREVYPEETFEERYKRLQKRLKNKKSK